MSAETHVITCSAIVPVAKTSRLLRAGRLVAIAARAGSGIVAAIFSNRLTCRKISPTEDDNDPSRRLLVARSVAYLNFFINAFIYAEFKSAVLMSASLTDKIFSTRYWENNFHIRQFTIDNTHDPFKPKNGSAITARIMSGGSDNRDVVHEESDDSKESWQYPAIRARKNHVSQHTKTPEEKFQKKNSTTYIRS